MSFLTRVVEHGDPAALQAATACKELAAQLGVPVDDVGELLMLAILRPDTDESWRPSFRSVFGAMSRTELGSLVRNSPYLADVFDGLDIDWRPVRSVEFPSDDAD